MCVCEVAPASLPASLPSSCAGYVQYLEQEVTRLKLANRLAGSAEPAREAPPGGASHGGGWEGQGEGIVQQALLAAMKTEEGMYVTVGGGRGVM